MERKGHSQPVQGDGSGEGFQDPLQVQGENDEQRSKIRADIEDHADGGISERTYLKLREITTLKYGELNSKIK